MDRLPVFPRLGASACVWRGDRVLIVQRAKPPLRGVEPARRASRTRRNVKAAAARELAEETGVEADLTQLVDIVDVIRHDDGGPPQFPLCDCLFCRALDHGEPAGRSDALAARWSAIGELTACHDGGHAGDHPARRTNCSAVEANSTKSVNPFARN